MTLLSHYEPLLSPEWSSTGVFFLVAACCYSLFILGGIGGILYFNAKEKGDYSPIRIRGPYLTISALIVIQVYVVSLGIAYQMNNRFTCRQEFWIMNTVFPAGVALFQIANLRLFVVAKRQDECIKTGKWTQDLAPFGFRCDQFMAWVKGSNFVRKVWMSTLMGVFLQIWVALFLFFGSRRFSPDTGFFGQHVDPMTCRRGYEWIPSILWQFFWAWIMGPVILWKGRHLRDNLHFARQTRLCVWASLPGAPLWIIFLYANSSGTKIVNALFPPAMWFGPGLVMMQSTMILYTILPSLRRTPADWKSYRSAKVKSLQPEHPLYGITSSWISEADIVNSKAAFNHQLATHPTPLINFARREFAAENIDFLLRVNRWRKDVTSGKGSADHTRQYHAAAQIYNDVVGALNLDMREVQQLAHVFHDHTRETRTSSLKSIAPFFEESEWFPAPPSPPSIEETKHGAVELVSCDTSDSPITPLTPAQSLTPSLSTKTVSDTITARSSASLVHAPPPEFNVHVFDAAYSRIHELAFRNQWAHFVRSFADFGEAMVEGVIVVPGETLKEMVGKAKVREASMGE